MEFTPPLEDRQPSRYHLEFWGKGNEYFSIMIVNWLLTLLTVGLYYPWARAKRLEYIYGNISLDEHRFHFSGTGKEMFIGFIKLIGLYLAAMFVYAVLRYIGNSPLLAILFLYAAIFAFVPLAIHGAFRYRMSRLSYRGIRFGFRGDRNTLFREFLKGVLLTIVTLGIYALWLEMNVRRYTVSHVRYGDVRFSSNCEGTEWFVINLKGYFLTIFTFGIYSFWWMKERFEYKVRTTTLYREEKKITCYSTATGMDFLTLHLVNFLLVILTLGLGFAWAEMRTQKFYCKHIQLVGDIDTNTVVQTEESFTDAMGEDALDFMDIDIA